MGKGEKLVFQPIGSDDTFKFQCSGCGECCRHAKESVMVESLDLFRIARHMNKAPSEIMDSFTVPVLLEHGFPVLMMKTVAPKDSCIFLKDGKCGIYGIKPRACRLYPLGVAPDFSTPGEFQGAIVSSRQHHFTGKRHRVKDWLDENFTAEDRAYILAEYAMVAEAAGLLRIISGEYDAGVIRTMLLSRYILFNTEYEFQPQYKKNVAHLIKTLQEYADKSKGK